MHPAPDSVRSWTSEHYPHRIIQDRGVSHAIWDAVSWLQTWNPRGGFTEEFCENVEHEYQMNSFNDNLYYEIFHDTNPCC